MARSLRFTRKPFVAGAADRRISRSRRVAAESWHAFCIQDTGCQSRIGQAAALHEDTMRGEFSAIPIVDVSPLAEGAAQTARATTVAALRDALERSGFAYLAGHGVAQPMIDRLRALSEAFHALPAASKRAILMNDYHRGYMPFSTSTIVTSTVATVTRPKSERVADGDARGQPRRPLVWAAAPGSESLAGRPARTAQICARVHGAFDGAGPHDGGRPRGGSRLAAQLVRPLLSQAHSLSAAVALPPTGRRGRPLRFGAPYGLWVYHDPRAGRCRRTRGSQPPRSMDRGSPYRGNVRDECWRHPATVVEWAIRVDATPRSQLETTGSLFDPLFL